MEALKFSKAAVYIPAPRAVRVTRSERLPRELAVASASAFFRAVPWGGELPEQAPVSGPAPLALDPRLPARLAFAQVAWTGEAPSEQTSTQQRSSVAAVLATFKWD